MFAFLLILLVLDGLLLTVVILLQAGKGDGLAAMGGASSSTDSVIGGRQAATLLTRATWAGGGIFLGLALVLSILSSRAEGTADSILRQEFQQGAPAAPQPIVPGTEPEGGELPAIPGTEPTGSTEPPADDTPDGQ